MPTELEAIAAIWQPYSAKQLSEADAREILGNLTGFFDVLSEWAAQDALTVGSQVIK